VQNYELYLQIESKDGNFGTEWILEWKSIPYCWNLDAACIVVRKMKWDEWTIGTFGLKINGIYFVFRSVCTTFGGNRKQAAPRKEKKKLRLFLCPSLGLHYLWIRVGGTSEIKINGIYFVFRSVCTTFGGNRS
jgi:hypothetical protein